MSTQEIGDLCSRLGRGWTNDQNSILYDFARSLSKAFGANVIIKDLRENAAVFFVALEEVRLRNFDNTYIVVLGGDKPDKRLVTELRYGWAGDDRLTIVIVASETRLEEAQSLFSAQSGCVTIHRHYIRHLLESSQPIEQLKRIAREQLSLIKLSPFNVIRIPSRNMFFGRENILEDLLNSESQSWAIAGPGKIGKSSVLHHYRNLLAEIDAGRKARAIYADFYDLSTLDETSITRHIAKAVNPNRRSEDVTLDTLKRFLFIEKYNLPPGRFEFLFDEVDRVCASETFRRISQWAKDGFCRLILCGKWPLYEALHDGNHQLNGRLQLMRLEPLKFKDAVGLFLLPLRDLGFKIHDEPDIVREVFIDTGGYPNLIQYLGMQLVSQAKHVNRKFIDYRLLQEVRNKYETAQFFLNPLTELNDDTTELLALTLLYQSPGKFAEQNIRSISDEVGLRLNEREISAICRRLYITNILTWDKDHYRVASGGLLRYARELGYYTPRFNELRRKVLEGSSSEFHRREN